MKPAFAFATVFLASISSASAATYYTSPGDNNLRQLVSAANANPGDDTIVMAGGTYTLSDCPSGSGDENTDPNLNGDLDVRDPSGGTLTLVATGWPNSPEVKLTTTCAQRFIDNHGPAAVWIKGLTFIGGTSSSFGGAIKSQMSPLVLDGAVFKDNTARFGAAVWTSGSSLVIRDSWFEDNYSTESGGALDVASGWATIEDSTFLSNGAAENGGAIHFNNGGYLQMDHTLIEGNWAKEGGGLYMVNVQATIADTTFRYNYANSDVQGFNGNGGAAFIMCTTSSPNWDPRSDDGLKPPFIPDCETSFINSNFELNVVDGNNSASGGAIWAWLAIVNLRESRVIGNYSEGSGGAITFFQSHGRFDDNTFSNNIAGKHSGVIDVRGTSYWVSHNNDFTNNKATEQGGVTFVAQNSIWISQLDTFQSNQSKIGGAVVAQSESRLVMLQDSFLGNYASERCGAIDIFTARSAELDRSLVSGNRSSMGGGVCGSALFVVDSVITQNVATAGGGGVRGHVSSGSYQYGVRINNSTISYNHAETGGGGASGRISTENSTFVGNTVTNHRGTAIMATQGESISLRNTTITRNGTVDALYGSQVHIGGPWSIVNTYIGGAVAGEANCYFQQYTPPATTLKNSYDTDGTCQLPNGVNGNVSGGALALFGELGDFGGYTPTLRMYPSSPIINRYQCSWPNDQRHVPRPQGGRCDIGATEYGKEDFPVVAQLRNDPYDWSTDAAMLADNAVLLSAGEAAPHYPREIIPAQ